MKNTNCYKYIFDNYNKFKAQITVEENNTNRQFGLLVTNNNGFIYMKSIKIIFPKDFFDIILKDKEYIPNDFNTAFDSKIKDQYNSFLKHHYDDIVKNFILRYNFTDNQLIFLSFLIFLPRVKMYKDKLLDFILIRVFHDEVFLSTNTLKLTKHNVRVYKKKRLKIEELNKQEYYELSSCEDKENFSKAYSFIKTTFNYSAFYNKKEKKFKFFNQLFKEKKISPITLDIFSKLCKSKNVNNMHFPHWDEFFLSIDNKDSFRIKKRKNNISLEKIPDIINFGFDDYHDGKYIIDKNFNLYLNTYDGIKFFPIGEPFHINVLINYRTEELDIKKGLNVIIDHNKIFKFLSKNDKRLYDIELLGDHLIAYKNKVFYNTSNDWIIGREAYLIKDGVISDEIYNVYVLNNLQKIKKNKKDYIIKKGLSLIYDSDKKRLYKFKNNSDIDCENYRCINKSICVIESSDKYYCLYKDEVYILNKTSNYIPFNNKYKLLKCLKYKNKKMIAEHKANYLLLKI